MKAILSQFSNSREEPAAPTSKKKCRVTKHRRGAVILKSTRGCGVSSDSDSNDSDLSDADGCLASDDGDDEDDESDADAPDQDDDIIRAAEADQQADLDEAEQTAELKLPVTSIERKVASMALSKVG